MIEKELLSLTIAVDLRAVCKTEEDVQDQLVNVRSIQSSNGAFAAIREDGSVVTWGNANNGSISTDVQENEQLHDVIAIQSTLSAFAALRSDASVVAWGAWDLGGDASAVQPQLSKEDGSVVTWGGSHYGGDSSQVKLQAVQSIQRSCHGFAALQSDGHVVSWGGGAHSVRFGDVEEELWEDAFAAIRSDGRVITWGSSSCGGDSRAVQEELCNVQQIQAGSFAFVAICGDGRDGRVVSWGGPGGDSSEAAYKDLGLPRTQSVFGNWKEPGACDENLARTATVQVEGLLVGVFSNLQIKDRSLSVREVARKDAHIAAKDKEPKEALEKPGLFHTDTLGNFNGFSKRTQLMDEIMEAGVSSASLDHGQTGSVYALEAGDHKIAVFKPVDGEKFSRKSLDAGKGAIREEAVYLVDRICGSQARDLILVLCWGQIQTSHYCPLPKWIAEHLHTNLFVERKNNWGDVHQDVHFFAYEGTRVVTVTKLMFTSD
eukprot:s1710_g1.t3